MLSFNNDILGTARNSRESGMKKNRHYTKKGPGRVTYNKGNPHKPHNTISTGNVLVMPK
jgi:hypothetical protein